VIPGHLGIAVSEAVHWTEESKRVKAGLFTQVCKLHFKC